MDIGADTHPAVVRIPAVTGSPTVATVGLLGLAPSTTVRPPGLDSGVDVRYRGLPRPPSWSKVDDRRTPNIEMCFRTTIDTMAFVDADCSASGQHHSENRGNQNDFDVSKVHENPPFLVFCRFSVLYSFYYYTIMNT